jgi:hypothetical protein
MLEHAANVHAVVGGEGLSQGIAGNEEMPGEAVQR